MGYRILERGQFPARLLDLAEPPSRLYLHGRWPEGPVVAVVGTRHASAEAVDFTHTLCRELAAAGVLVASGGAEGIDTAAHRGALDGSGRTLVVAPSGFRRPFPAKNRPLFTEVVEREGGYVSEHDENTSALRHFFFSRNAILVALSELVVVVESPFRSGARNAAGCARRLSRRLFVVPHAPWNGRGSGWIEHFRLGASLCSGSKDVLAALEAVQAHAIPPETARVTGSRDTQQLELPALAPRDALGGAILETLAQGSLHLDELAERLAQPARTVHAAVAELCVEQRLSLNAAGVVSVECGAKGV